MLRHPKGPQVQQHDGPKGGSDQAVQPAAASASVRRGPSGRRPFPSGRGGPTPTRRNPVPRPSGRRPRARAATRSTGARGRRRPHWRCPARAGMAPGVARSPAARPRAVPRAGHLPRLAGAVNPSRLVLPASPQEVPVRRGPVADERGRPTRSGGAVRGPSSQNGRRTGRYLRAGRFSGGHRSTGTKLPLASVWGVSTLSRRDLGAELHPSHPDWAPE
jgi:hypothetical protein